MTPHVAAVLVQAQTLASDTHTLGDVLAIAVFAFVKYSDHLKGKRRDTTISRKLDTIASDLSDVKADVARLEGRMQGHREVIGDPIHKPYIR